MNKYITLSEASELIGKSKETLRRWRWINSILLISYNR